MDSQHPSRRNLILQSDQGSHYTSMLFIEFCESVHVIVHTQSRIPIWLCTMERYFNTHKNGCANLYGYRREDKLYQTVEKFAYVIFNHVRPRRYNGYRTPYQVRTTAKGEVGACLLIGLLDYPKSELPSFVNGLAAQWYIALLTKDNSSDSLHATVQ